MDMSGQSFELGLGLTQQMGKTSVRVLKKVTRLEEVDFTWQSNKR